MVSAIMIIFKNVLLLCIVWNIIYFPVLHYATYVSFLIS